MKPSNTRAHYGLAIFSAYLCSFSIGMGNGYSSPVTVELERKFPSIDFSLFASLLTVGALFGGLLAGVFTERLGRAGTILFSTLFATVGWLLTLFQVDVAMLYASRFILGWSLGIQCMVVPVYISEVSPADCRGIYGAGHQLSIVLGVLACFVLGKKDWLSSTPLALVSFLPVVAAVLTMVSMPESPTWLIEHDMPDSMVMKSLHYLFGQTEFADSQREILSEARQSNRADFSIVEIANPSVLRPLSIALSLMFIQQACGVSAVFFYTDTIFRAAGSSLDTSLESIIVGAVQVVFTFLATVIIDRSGRRTLLLTSGTVCLIGMCLLILYYDLRQRYVDTVSTLYWLPSFSLSVFVAGFSLGFGPVPALLMSELLPTRARGIGTGLCVALNSLCAFVMTKFFPGVMASFGAAETYSVFAVLIVFSIIVIYFAVPETKNKTLQEIEAMFRGQDTEPADLAYSVLTNDTHNTHDTNSNSSGDQSKL